MNSSECANETDIETNVETSSTSGTEYRRRKHLKKIKKKRLLESQEGKKKHKKHRSRKEHRRHKHKKHRKHKHRHHSGFGDTSNVSNWENNQEQRNDEETITNLPSTNFPAAEETYLSEEDDETEGSLLTIEKDDEAQMESEESLEPTQKNDVVFEVISEKLSEPVIQETQLEPEEPSEPVQVYEEAQMDFTESSDDVQTNDKQSEESSESTRKKTQPKAASTKRTSTIRSTMSNIACRISKIGSISKVSRGSKMNRVSTNRASTRNTSTTSTSRANTNRASKNRATVQTNPGPSNPVETPSPIARMLPNKCHWKWASSSRVSGGNQYFTAIRRGKETINIGDSVLFYSYRKPHEKPYIGKIVSLWLNQKLEMRVRSQWFYRPEELQQPCILDPPGGLFESKHSDSNDVQTISHKVMVLPLEDYNKILQASQKHQKGFEDNDPYYYDAGFYMHPTVTYAPGVTAVLQE